MGVMFFSECIPKLFKIEYLRNECTTRFETSIFNHKRAQIDLANIVHEDPMRSSEYIFRPFFGKSQKGIFKPIKESIEMK